MPLSPTMVFVSMSIKMSSISSDSLSERLRLWANCADAHADIRLCCTRKTWTLFVRAISKHVFISFFCSVTFIITFKPHIEKLYLWNIFRQQSLVIKNAPSEDSYHTVRMRRLVWIFAGRIRPQARFLSLRHVCLAQSANWSCRMLFAYT